MMQLRFLAVTLFIFAGTLIAPAYAHYFGATKNVGGYQIVFQPYPSAPIIGTNSSINFSVLTGSGDNLYNVYSSIVITDKHTGKPVYQVPYRLYEISDIATKYRFDNPGDYVATIQTRIPGDPKYASQPLEASFDVTAFPPGIPLDELMLYYVTPAALVLAGVAVYLHSKGKL